MVQLHSSDYRTPSGLPAGSCWWSGAATPGFQIAEELARSRQVHLAVGSRQLPLPQRILGRDLFRALDATGLMRTTVTSRVGRRMKDRETLVGSSPRAARGSASACARERPMPRARPCSSPTAPRSAVDAVVWATGFRLDHSFVELPVFDDAGRVQHERGVTKVPGLYFLGLPWQHTRGSALLGWVEDDARYLAGRIGAFARSPAATRA